MTKSLDTKLAELRGNPNNRTFIIAYAADSDMALGVATVAGMDPSIHAYYDDLQAITQEADIDILLASVSTMDVLAREHRIFDASPVTPAIRANDTTDIWHPRGASYAAQPSRPFATTTIEEAQYGTLTPAPGQVPDVNLGLYSVTFNNDLDADWLTLERFKMFRTEAGRKGFRYFLEVFNPNIADCGLREGEIPDFVNDHIARMLAGIPRAARPEFLKIAYNGPASMEALVAYDSTVIVGVLGGPASTTYDAYKLITEAKRYGARLALFGRRIKGAEDPLIFTRLLRAVADEEIGPEEGVKAYHGELQKQRIMPYRDLETDMVLHTPALTAGL
jgi:hypothetical protein